MAREGEREIELLNVLQPSPSPSVDSLFFKLRFPDINFLSDFEQSTF